MPLMSLLLLPLAEEFGLLLPLVGELLEACGVAVSGCELSLGAVALWLPGFWSVVPGVLPVVPMVVVGEVLVLLLGCWSTMVPEGAPVLGTVWFWLPVALAPPSRR